MELKLFFLTVFCCEILVVFSTRTKSSISNKLTSVVKRWNKGPEVQPGTFLLYTKYETYLDESKVVEFYLGMSEEDLALHPETKNYDKDTRIYTVPPGGAGEYMLELYFEKIGSSVTTKYLHNVMRETKDGVKEAIISQRGLTRGLSQYGARNVRILDLAEGDKLWVERTEGGDMVWIDTKDMYQMDAQFMFQGGKMSGYSYSTIT